MKLLYLYWLLGLSVLLWLIFCVAMFMSYRLGGMNGLELIGIAISGFILSTGLFLIGYTFYLMNRVVPQIAAIVNPAIHDLMINNTETAFFKFHWLSTYSACIVSQRLNRRFVRRGAVDNYDFRELDKTLRIPILVWLYWLNLAFISGVVGGGILKLSEYLGN